MRKPGGNVLATLRRRIMLNDLAPGSVLTELGLATDLACSQAAIREALLRLEGEGLVRRAGHQGTMVTDLDADAAMEILDLRRRDFHLALVRISGLHALEPILLRCIQHTGRFKLWAPWHQRPLMQTAMRHQPILAALRGDDTAALGRALGEHLDTIVERRNAA